MDEGAAEGKRFYFLIVEMKEVTMWLRTEKIRRRAGNTRLNQLQLWKACLLEVSLLKKLEHPNIVRLYDAFICEGQLVLEIEWAEAGDLKRQIRKALKKSASLLLDLVSWCESPPFLVIIPSHRLTHVPGPV